MLTSRGENQKHRGLLTVKDCRSELLWLRINLVLFVKKRQQLCKDRKRIKSYFSVGSKGHIKFSFLIYNLHVATIVDDRQYILYLIH